MEVAGFRFGIAEIAASIAIVAIAYMASGYAMELGKYSYLGVFLITLISSATILVPAPGWAVVIGLSATLDPLMLGIAAGLGSGIGEITGYLLGAGGAKIASRRKKKEKKHPHHGKVMEFVRRHEDAGVFALAAIPNPLFDIAGIAAGAIRMPWYRFLIACTLGKIVRYVVFLFALGRLSHWLF
ncbi:MAG: VTT domain-containing protein [Candidatus Micrarchaeia archaeon]